MKVEWWVEDGYINRKPNYVLEIPDEDLEDMTEAERDRHIDLCVEEARDNKITLGWKIVEGDNDAGR